MSSREARGSWDHPHIHRVGGSWYRDFGCFGNRGGSYESYKHQMGRSLLLGLEFLVAGDVVRTVALEPTLNNVAVLGLLVLVRTFLGWSLAVEIEGRWPWQARAEKDTPVRTTEEVTRSCETTRKPDSREGLQ